MGFDFGKAVDIAQKVWDNGGKEVFDKLTSKEETSQGEKHGIASETNESSGIDGVIDTAKKIWDNGGKEVAETILTNFIASNGNKPEKMNALVDDQTSVDEIEYQDTPETLVAEVIDEYPENEPEKTSSGINKVHDDMSDEEEDAFVESLQNGFSNVSASNPTEALQALTVFVEATNETIKFVKMQETKQTQILADRDKKIAQIEATKEILKEYLDKTFDERKDAFNKYFEVVDAALEKGDTAVLSKALDSINSLATSSPFKDLSNMQTFTTLMSNNEDLDI